MHGTLSVLPRFFFPHMRVTDKSVCHELTRVALAVFVCVGEMTREKERETVMDRERTRTRMRMRERWRTKE